MEIRLQIPKVCDPFLKPRRDTTEGICHVLDEMNVWSDTVFKIIQFTFSLH